MGKRLGNICVLVGLFCLLVFFFSSAFLVDQAWFLMGGIGFTALGLLLKRRNKLKRDRRWKLKRAQRRDRRGDDESS
jgi:hypothetical protein